MSYIPQDDARRKGAPMFRGLLGYFPAALADMTAREQAAIQQAVAATWDEAAAIVEQQEKDMEPLRKALENDDDSYVGPDFISYEHQFKAKARAIRSAGGTHE